MRTGKIRLLTASTGARRPSGVGVGVPETPARPGRSLPAAAYPLPAPSPPGPSGSPSAWSGPAGSPPNRSGSHEDRPRGGVIPRCCHAAGGATRPRGVRASSPARPRPPPPPPRPPRPPPPPGGEVPDPAQQPVGDPRRAAGSSGDLGRTVGVQPYAEQPRRPGEHLLEVARLVEVHVGGEPEPVAQRPRQQPGPRRGGDEGEG